MFSQISDANTSASGLTFYRRISRPFPGPHPASAILVADSSYRNGIKLWNI
jgi:hypothetical protein